MSIHLPRRHLLAGLAAVMAAPMIVKIENIMPVKNTDLYHLVRINGFDAYNNPVSELIQLRECLVNGLDMAGYNRHLERIRPGFQCVTDISWSKGLLRVKPFALNGDLSSPWIDRHMAVKAHFGRT